jgi:hypothetical protein
MVGVLRKLTRTIIRGFNRLGASVADIFCKH